MFQVKILSLKSKVKLTFYFYKTQINFLNLFVFISQKLEIQCRNLLFKKFKLKESKAPEFRNFVSRIKISFQFLKNPSISYLKEHSYLKKEMICLNN